MDVNELRELTLDRLGALEQGLRKQLFDARIKNHTNQLDDTASIRRLRRELARIKTIQSEKLLSGVVAEELTDDEDNAEAEEAEAAEDAAAEDAAGEDADVEDAEEAD